MADDTRKYKTNKEMDNDSEEEEINLYDKETIEQRRLMNMDDDEYMDYERKSIKDRLYENKQSTAL